ncbi:MAG: DNA-processing protein DprA, partial [Treponema sp.]|nr:DNA-processing protein DprA [Treponema sp.]
GTIIVEAPEKSGALITADFAIEQGRDLWVTRTGVNSFKGKGTAKLAADGAKVIESAQEIMAEWGLLAQKDTGPEPVDTQTPVGTQTPAAAATAALAGKILASDLARSLNIENILDDK